MFSCAQPQRWERHKACHGFSSLSSQHLLGWGRRMVTSSGQSELHTIKGVGGEKEKDSGEVEWIHASSIQKPTTIRQRDLKGGGKDTNSDKMKRRRQQLNTKQNQPQPTKAATARLRNLGSRWTSWCRLSRPVCHLLSPGTAKLSSQGVCSNDSFSGFQVHSARVLWSGGGCGAEEAVGLRPHPAPAWGNPLSHTHPWCPTLPPGPPILFYFI